MMKKIICILCVLSTVFLCSCKFDALLENDTTTQTQANTDVSDTEPSETEKETESTTQAEKYQGGQHKFEMTDVRKKALTEKQYEAYKVIVNAMDTGKTEISVDLDGEDSYNKIKSALWSSYPLYALVQEMHYSRNTETITVVYSKSRAELTKTIEAFYNKIDSIITKELLALDETSKALKLYEYIASKTPSDNNSLTVYDLIMKGEGTDIEFSMAYEYLLGLVGVECNHATSEVGEKQIALTQVKIGKNYYYSSPYHEAKKNNGELLEFFGMDDERAKIATGAGKFFSTNNNYEKVELPECKDETFSFTKYLEEWSLDTDKKIITYEITDNIYSYKY